MALAIPENGSIVNPDHYKLYDSLKKTSIADPDLNIWQDVFGVSISGKIYLLHGFWYAIIGTPFALVLGKYGLLLCNQLVLFLILVCSFRIARHLSNEKTALYSSIILLVGSQLIFYSYSYSYDLFGACLIIVGLDLSRRYPLIGAALMMLACESKPSNVLYAAVLSWTWLYLYSNRLSAIRRIIFGLILGGSVVALWNFYIWGSPFTTGYHRFPSFQNGEPVFDLSSYKPSISVFISDWGAKLFSKNVGIVPANIAVVLYPLSLFFAFRNKLALTFAVITLAIGLHFIFVYSLPIWDAYGSGKRYLMTAIILAVIHSSIFLEALQVKPREARR